MKKLTQKEKFPAGLVGGIAGIITGAGIGLMVGLETIKSPTGRARFIEKEDTPRIMKVYNYMRANQILIENPDIVGEYISLSNYLERDFKNKYERNLEKAKIELLVSQTENKK